MRTATLVVLASAILALVGCSSSENKNRVPVVGVVTLKKQPVTGAMVQFVPLTGKGEIGSGRTDATGKYELINSKGGPGVPPGEYKVIISRVVDPKGKELPPDASPHSSEGKESLPLIYSSPEDTILKANVAAGSATVDFPLTGQGGALTGVPGTR